MNYVYMYVCFFMCLLSIIFMMKYTLGVLILLEGLSLILFYYMILNYEEESFFELILFLVAIVSDSILGLLVMLLKVSITGQDILNFYNVI